MFPLYKNYFIVIYYTTILRFTFFFGIQFNSMSLVINTAAHLQTEKSRSTALGVVATAASLLILNFPEELDLADATTTTFRILGAIIFMIGWGTVIYQFLRQPDEVLIRTKGTEGTESTVTPSLVTVSDATAIDWNHYGPYLTLVGGICVTLGVLMMYYESTSSTTSSSSTSSSSTASSSTPSTALSSSAWLVFFVGGLFFMAIGRHSNKLEWWEWLPKSSENSTKNSTIVNASTYRTFGLLSAALFSLTFTFILPYQRQHLMVEGPGSIAFVFAFLLLYFSNGPYLRSEAV